jgi:predicted metal-binding protein
MPPAITEWPVRMDVCVTCRAGQPAREEEGSPGQDLYAALAAEAARDPASGWIELHAVACLASCARGCAMVISQPGKWSTLLGGLGAELAADLVTYARAYRSSKTGALMPSKRPASLSQAVLARIPSFIASDQAAE